MSAFLEITPFEFGVAVAVLGVGLAGLLATRRYLSEEAKSAKDQDVHP